MMGWQICQTGGDVSPVTPGRGDGRRGPRGRAGLASLCALLLRARGACSPPAAAPEDVEVGLQVCDVNSMRKLTGF